MRIFCTGINHRTAAVRLRERLAFNEQDARRALGLLRETYGAVEFVVLGTCNRSEIYCARPVHGHPRESELAEFLGRFHGVPTSEFVGNLYSHADGEAVRHLFEVACGLDSLVLGESQVLAQVKQAYALACEAGTAGKIFNALFQRSFNVGKRVQSETAINVGRVSVAGVAVDVAAEALGEGLSQRSVLNIGAGKMNGLMLRHLRELGCRKFVVLNRSAENARELAAEFGGQAGSLEELPERLAEADVVVTSTGAHRPIITREMVVAAQTRRGGRAMLIIDVAVPRDVAGEAGEVEGVHLYNIDDLSAGVEKTVCRRREHVESCRAIVREHVEEFDRWLAAREVAPTIEALRRKIRLLADEELLAARNKFSTHEDSEQDERIMSRVLHRMVQRFLHAPIEKLRSNGGGSEAARMHAASLRKLFDLDEVD